MFSIPYITHYSAFPVKIPDLKGSGILTNEEIFPFYIRGQTVIH